MVMLQENKEKQLTGDQMNAIYFNISLKEQEDGFKNLESIKMEWEFGKKILEDLKQTIHDTYVLNRKNYFDLRYKQESSLVRSLLPKKEKNIELLYSAKF